MELFCPLGCFWHVIILEFTAKLTQIILMVIVTLWKLRLFSKLIVGDIGDYDANTIFRLEEIALHPRVVEDLFRSSDNNFIRPRKRTIEVKGSGHLDDFFAALCFCLVRCPWVEDVLGVWQKEAVIVGFGAFKHLKESVSDLWLSRDTLICSTSKDQEDVLASVDFNLTLLDNCATTGHVLWEHGFIIGFSTTVEDSNNVTVVQLTQSAESCLEVVKRSFCIRQNDLALIAFHYAMTGIIHDGQCLSVGICVIQDLLLILSEYRFEAGVVGILFCQDVNVTKTVVFDVFTKGFDVLFDF